MEYISLFKQYVMTNYSECYELYKNRFDSESSYHFNFKIGEYDAFIFCHPSIYSKVCSIYQLNKEVEAVFSSLPLVAQEHYIKKCLIDEVQFTNEIEGVASTRKEINTIIDSIERNKKNNGYRIEGIVNSYRKLIDGNSIDLNTSSDVRAIYDALLLHEIESENPSNVPDGLIFRAGQVEVDNFGGDSIHKGVFPEKDIITYMDNALSILKNSDIDPLISASIFHYLFGYIHPFYDGNGRMSRFITSYLLSKVLAPITSFRISMTIKEKIGDYYKAFKQTNDSRNFGDIGTFVDVMLDIIIESEKKTILYAKDKMNTICALMDKISKTGDHTKKETDFLYVLVQASLFSSEGISLNSLNKILKLDPKTIKDYIDKNQNLISINKQNKEYLYSIDTMAIKQLNETL